MILLLTRENSSYDSATKTFWFKMDKQLDSSVKVIRIQTFSFQPTTTATYPHGVLVCSETLSNMSMRQHVNVLTFYAVYTRRTTTASTLFTRYSTR